MACFFEIDCGFACGVFLGVSRRAFCADLGTFLGEATCLGSIGSMTLISAISSTRVESKPQAIFRLTVFQSKEKNWYGFYFEFGFMKSTTYTN